MRKVRRGRVLDVLSMFYKLGVGRVVEDVLSHSGKLRCFGISTKRISYAEKMAWLILRSN
jgi:hypothetical protein